NETMSEIEPMVQKFVLDTMAPKAKPMTSPPSVSAMGPFSATSSRSAVIVSFLPCAAEAYRTFADLNMGEQARAEAPGQPRAGGIGEPRRYGACGIQVCHSCAAVALQVRSHCDPAGCMSLPRMTRAVVENTEERDGR